MSRRPAEFATRGWVEQRDEGVEILNEKEMAQVATGMRWLCTADGRGSRPRSDINAKRANPDVQKSRYDRPRTSRHSRSWSLVFVGPKTMWGLVGLIPLVTGLVGVCPIHLILRIRTCRLKAGRLDLPSLSAERPRSGPALTLAGFPVPDLPATFARRFPQRPSVCLWRSCGGSTLPLRPCQSIDKCFSRTSHR